MGETFEGDAVAQHHAATADEVLAALTAQIEAEEGAGERPDLDEQARQVRRINQAASVELVVVETGSEWTQRSEVLTWLCSRGAAIAMQNGPSLCQKDPRVALILGAATFCLGLGALCFFMFVPVMLAFVVWGLAF